MSQPVQDNLPRVPRMSKAQRELVQAEEETMLRKWTISHIDQTHGEYISLLFFGERKDGDQPPVITLKNQNFFVRYKHFKMESLNSLQFLSKRAAYMTKLDLNNAYFCVPLHKESQNFVWFQWDGKLYEFVCLCFSLGPAPRIFTKMLKKSLAVLRRMNMLIIINCLYRQYANNRLNQKGGGVNQGHSHLPPATFRFLLNLKKSVLQPCQEIKFLDLIVNYMNLTLSHCPYTRCRRSKKSAERCTTVTGHRFWNWPNF